MTTLGERGQEGFGVSALNDRDYELHDLIPFAPSRPPRWAGFDSVATYYAIASDFRTWRQTIVCTESADPCASITIHPCGFAAAKARY